MRKNGSINFYLISFLSIVFVCFTSVAVQAQEVPSQNPKLNFSISDLSGNLHNLGQNDKENVRAFVFLSTECPVANSYIPTLNKLSKEIASSKKPIKLYGVIYDSSIKRSAAAEHFKEYKLEIPVLFDSSGLIADALDPSHVPEAFVLNTKDKLVYRGALDNAWEEIGRRRPNPEKNYLSDAIFAAANNKTISITQTKPVGCLIEKLPEGKTQAKVTFNREIASIINSRCRNCHRPGQVAPFALTNYTEVAKRSGQILRVIKDRIMPPWIPDSSDHKFVDQRKMSEKEIELLETWVATGRTEGEAEDLPPAPQFAEGWRLGKPDLIVKMPEPFTVPADGPDVFQNFVIPIDIPEDKMVAAVEFHPGNKRVAHHSVLFLDSSEVARKLDAASPEPGYSSFGGPGFLPSGALGGWSAGNTARRLPNGMGRYLKKGSDLVVQMHYHPTGKVETDQSTLGIYFVEGKVAETLKQPAKLVGSIWLANYEMDIPAGESNYGRTTSYTLPKDVIMVGIVPHMHLLGKAMKVTAVLPDKEKVNLIDVKNWNYNWQDEYYYERPFSLPAGTKIIVDAVFDNSDENPSNPSSPPKRVAWGEGTEDEMLYCFFLLSAEKAEDLIHVIFDNLAHDGKQPRKKVK